MTEARAGARRREVSSRDAPPPDDLPVRRTIVIRGQVADRGLPTSARRRPGRTVQQRAIAKPDRVAMYAVLLGLLLVLVAATSAHS
jgi:hypothetical protein